MDTRKSKTIQKQEDINFLISLTENDITTSLINELFGQFESGQRFQPYDIITIPANSYGADKKKNKEPFVTTVGIWIFNKYFIEKDLFNIFHYLNETIDSKLFNKINTILSECLLEDRIETSVLDRYIMKTQKCMPYISILAPNYTNKMLSCTKVIDKKKAELYKKYKKEIDEGQELVADKMEKELLDFAMEYMKDDPSMDMFISGARGNVGNNFKNMFVMKGVIKDPDPNAKKKYNVALSNYIDGISPDEYSLFANSLAAGPYSRANKTAIGGYLEKLFLMAFQHLVADPPGSDCGTKRYLTVLLTESNISEYMYNYIIEGQKLVELTSENKNKYIGKIVKIRFSSLCESKTGICSKCLGNLLYRRSNDRNIGVILTKIPSTMKNISMKAFHDSTQKFREMDLSKVFES